MWPKVSYKPGQFCGIPQILLLLLLSLSLSSLRLSFNSLFPLSTTPLLLFTSLLCSVSSKRSLYCWGTTTVSTNDDRPASIRASFRRSQTRYLTYNDTPHMWSRPVNDNGMVSLTTLFLSNQLTGDDRQWATRSSWNIPDARVSTFPFHAYTSVPRYLTEWVTCFRKQFAWAGNTYMSFHAIYAHIEHPLFA